MNVDKVVKRYTYRRPWHSAATGSGTGRLELIYDRADNSNWPTNGLFVYDPDYEAVTLKGTFLF